ncbi:hypothetical protein HPB48_026086 [Haemaphysalis longicornis]|uniref:Uncharacterized protein n=1 Tax=Haemaphysalis longicornis TaxID=44386 RepID=A0A9J6H9W3_HAELO|nr:hypothetical protein HPB48_026086 [Haemaphysalis longicornis]
MSTLVCIRVNNLFNVTVRPVVVIGIAVTLHKAKASRWLAPRCSRHNFIESQAVEKLPKLHPGPKATSERLIMDGDVVSLPPDIVIELPERIHVIDVAVACDATVGSLMRVNAETRPKYASLAPVLRPKPVNVPRITFCARGIVCAGKRRAAQEISLRDANLGWPAARTMVGSLLCPNHFSKLITAWVWGRAILLLIAHKLLFLLLRSIFLLFTRIFCGHYCG